MVANSEFTVSNRGTKMAGKQYTFRAKPERLTIYDEMGVDLVTLANNHVYDFGRDAFLDMLDSFDKYEIPRIGAGKNIEEGETNPEEIKEGEDSLYMYFIFKSSK